MACTPTTLECIEVPGGVIKLAGLGHHNRCLIPIQPGPPGSTIVVNPDGDGFCWQPTHRPANLTNNKAPFEWNVANQCGNIPLVTVTQNPDGSITVDPGDGGATITIPKGCCPTLTRNPDGSYTYDRGDGAPVTIPKDCCPTLVQNADGSYTFTNGDGSQLTFTVSPPGSTPHPPLTLTRNQDLTTASSRASLDAPNQVLNLPPAIFAHRRYDMPSGGKVFTPPNTWITINLTNNTPIAGVVRDTTGGVMTPASGGIVIPRTGYYMLEGNITFDPPTDANANHGIALTVNGAIYQRGSCPYLSGQPPQVYISFGYQFNAGDIIGLVAFTTNSTGNLHSSADLRVTWICD